MGNPRQAETRRGVIRSRLRGVTPTDEAFMKLAILWILLFQLYTGPAFADCSGLSPICWIGQSAVCVCQGTNCFYVCVDRL